MLGHVGLMNFLWRFDMLRNTERYTENEVVINFLNDQFPDTNCDNSKSIYSEPTWLIKCDSAINQFYSKHTFETYQYFRIKNHMVLFTA